QPAMMFRRGQQKEQWTAGHEQLTGDEHRPIAKAIAEWSCPETDACLAHLHERAHFGLLAQPHIQDLLGIDILSALRDAVEERKPAAIAEPPAETRIGQWSEQRSPGWDLRWERIPAAAERGGHASQRQGRDQ